MNHRNVTVLRPGAETTLLANRHNNESGASFGNGGGDGDGNNMTERLEKLEKKIEAIDSTLSRLNESFIRLDHKIDLQGEKLAGALELQSSKLASALELQSTKLTSELAMQSQKLTLSLENHSSVFDGKLKDQKIAIVFWVLTIPGALFGLIKLIDLLTSK